MSDYKQKLIDASYWDNSSAKDRIDEYEVLFCAESEPDYEMSLYATLRKDGQLFELEAGHCSCNGYDFEPAPVTLEYLQHRATKSESYWATKEQWADFGRVVAALAARSTEGGKP